MRIGYLRFDPTFGDVVLISMSTAHLEQDEADLIVLPELFATGYQFVSQAEVMDLAEPVPDGRTTRRLADITARRGMTIVAGVAERDGTLL